MRMYAIFRSVAKFLSVLSNGVTNLHNTSVVRIWVVLTNHNCNANVAKQKVL